jgi:hypothetical protein
MNTANAAVPGRFDGIHFLHNIPSAHHPDEKPGLVRRKTLNFYRKAVHAGKWQNFAAGIGTGAAYVCLHGLHWHPHWLTIIEYVRHPEGPLIASLSCIALPHRLILFFTNVAIFSVNLILLTVNTLSAPIHLRVSAECARSHRFILAQST